MEMLVTLVLVSMTTMLMFQMLGSYRVARERVQSQSGRIDRQSLFDGWLRASVQGLFIDHGLTFVGSDTAFEGTTLNALYALEATPTLVRWVLESREGRVEVVYFEERRERWRYALADTVDARFAYVDEAGKQHDAWPPKLGKQDVPLPSGVILLREDAAGTTRAVAAAVLGPLKPVPRLTGEEES